jgi:hypothetical protein
MRIEFLAPDVENPASVTVRVGNPIDYRCIRSNGEWTMDLAAPPKMTEVVLSADPVQRASQISEFSPQMQEALKTMPAGKKIVIKEFGLH